MNDQVGDQRLQNSGGRDATSAGQPDTKVVEVDNQHSDGRPLWDWRTKYPKEACAEMRVEAWALVSMLVVSVALSGLFLALPATGSKMTSPVGTLSISYGLLAVFFVGWVGGVTYSIKWLIHSVAHGKWHMDRRYWRLLTPALGGPYACVVMTLFSQGFIGQAANSGSGAEAQVASMAGIAALAFLVGYFSDGVSGLLSNIANAVFGTLEKK